MDLMNGVQNVELLLEVGTAITQQMDAWMSVESPAEMMSAGSDCCGSNNYPTQPN